MYKRQFIFVLFNLWWIELLVNYKMFDENDFISARGGGEAYKPIQFYPRRRKGMW